MVHVVSAERLILGSAGRFVANQVRISAAESGGAYRFVCVDHDLVVCCFLHCIQVVIHHPLSVVMFSARNDVAHIAALHGTIPVVYHKLIGFVHVAFIVAYGRGGFVVHHHFDTFACSVAVDFLYVEIRIRSHEVKHVVLAFPEPVFPSLVPSFHQHCIESVVGSEVNVTLHVGGVGRVLAVRFGLRVVCLTQLDAVHIIRVGPCAFPGNHVPPYTDIFHRMNP